MKVGDLPKWILINVVGIAAFAAIVWLNWNPALDPEDQWSLSQLFIWLLLEVPLLLFMLSFNIWKSIKTFKSIPVREAFPFIALWAIIAACWLAALGMAQKYV